MKRPNILCSELSSDLSLKALNDSPVNDSPVGCVLRDIATKQTNQCQKIRDQSLDVTVLLPDRRGFKFPSLVGKNIYAADLLLRMADHLKVDRKLMKECCSLWMVSPFLEVQLKPHHVPFEIREHWSDLLNRFADVDQKEKNCDEPFLYLKRNVYLSVQREIEVFFSNIYLHVRIAEWLSCSADYFWITVVYAIKFQIEDQSEYLTEILYLCAKQEVLEGRYPCDIETSIRLAALQLSIDLGSFDQCKYTACAVSDIVDKFIPVQHVQNVKSMYLFGFPIFGCKGLESDIIDELKIISSKYGNNHSKRKAYLEIVRCFPFYGSAFFHGYVERPPARSLKDIKRMILAMAIPEIEVYIGINYDYITIIDSSSHEILLIQSLSGCTWHYIDGFILHKTIFSHQAIMMEALMNILYNIVLSKNEEIKFIDDDEKECNNTHYYEKLKENKGESLFDELTFFNRKSIKIPAVSIDCDAVPTSFCNLEFKCKAQANGQYSRNSCVRQLDKLCLATFDGTERCIKAEGSLRYVFSEV
ncbi:unnamed protein product [Dracunculus medinensis]|uniref:FERM domain-containing protein 8 n=1 Tax=Dracunculus medinensis TaxID=318479 RepID=A0A0N4U118_DRAME|nr:unnamed protein product [Dracunculus medinensis]